MVAHRQRSFDVGAQVRAAVKGMVPKGQFETATINAVAITLLWRGVSLFESIVLLARHQHVDEGLILARSLFEDSLTLQELLVAEADRAALVFKWLSMSLSEKEELIKVAKRLDLPGDQDAELAELAVQRRQVQEFAARNGVSKAKSFLTAKDAALKFGRKTDYWSYCLAHEFVHGSDASAVFRRRKDSSGALVFHGRTSDEKLIAGLIAFAARSLIELSRAVAGMLKWDDKGELGRVAKMVAALEE